MNEPEDQIIFGVGFQFWYDEGAILLSYCNFPVANYINRHAMGDPGESVESLDEILDHATAAASEEGEVTSTYSIPDGRKLHITTNHNEKATYLYVR